MEDYLHSRDNFSPSLISHEESREPNFCCPFPTVWSGWERDRGAGGNPWGLGGTPQEVLPMKAPMGAPWSAQKDPIALESLAV